MDHIWRLPKTKGLFGSLVSQMYSGAAFGNAAPLWLRECITSRSALGPLIGGNSAVHACMYVCMHVCMFTCMYVYMCTYVCMYVYISVMTGVQNVLN